MNEPGAGVNVHCCKVYKILIIYSIMKFGLFNALLLLHAVNGYNFALFSSPIRNKSQFKKYPFSQCYYEKYIKRLNSNNQTIQTNEILGDSWPEKIIQPLEEEEEEEEEEDDDDFDPDDILGQLLKDLNATDPEQKNGVRIFIDQSTFEQIAGNMQLNNNAEEDDDDEGRIGTDMYGNRVRTYGRNKNVNSQSKRSEHFEVISKSPVNFTDVGGYENIKSELNQCIDILSNYTKYAPYNVRTPKGLIFEGPPGNGKTLLAKALAGQANTAFIAVSGSEFQEKYVGVGASRVRELFKLAKENVPCIIFIDEIDALGRKRSGSGDTSGNERDSTLNELLVALDGFKNTSGIFIIGATNRVDLLDDALIRPGRIDKHIYIGNPDEATRRAILQIHSKGKPYDSSVIMEDVVTLTTGLSCAQIENLLNEAMLNALRYDRTQFTNKDLDEIMNKIMVGWQPNEHKFTSNIVDKIAIHELGHAVVGLLSKHHAKMTKVVINWSAPTSPAYTIFESSTSNILTREALFEHLMILLAGRIAEEVFYDVYVTTGAMNDFEEALKLAEKMICYYGMGKNIIYPSNSEKYKSIIDTEVAAIIHDAYGYAEFIIRNSKDLISEGAEILKRDKILTSETLINLMNTKHTSVLNLKI